MRVAAEEIKLCFMWAKISHSNRTTNVTQTVKFFFTMVQPPPPPVGQGPLVNEDSRSHSDTPPSVGLFWTIDQPITETST
jgi:hypothetical protein